MCVAWFFYRISVWGFGFCTVSYPPLLAPPSPPGSVGMRPTHTSHACTTHSHTAYTAVTLTLHALTTHAPHSHYLHQAGQPHSHAHTTHARTAGTRTTYTDATDAQTTYAHTLRVHTSHTHTKDSCLVVAGSRNFLRRVPTSTPSGASTRRGHSEGLHLVAAGTSSPSSAASAGSSQGTFRLYSSDVQPQGICNEPSGMSHGRQLLADERRRAPPHPTTCHFITPVSCHSKRHVHFKP